MFSGLASLVVEDVADEGEVIQVSARTRAEPVPCPVRWQLTGRVHGFHRRTIADVPVDGRRVVVSVRVRRLVCLVLGCPPQTFREQVPGLIERYQRRTRRLADQLGQVVKELAGRAGSRLSRALAAAISRSTALAAVEPAAPACAAGATGPRCRRLRAQAPPPLRHDPDRRRDRRTGRRAPGPQRRWPGAVAARTPRRGDRLPRRFTVP